MAEVKCTEITSLRKNKNKTIGLPLRKTDRVEGIFA